MYKIAKEFLDGLELPSGSTKRYDCPVCGGSNTFSVTNDCGKNVYNCYKAGCPARGITGGTMSINDIESSLHPKEPKRPPFDVPSYFVPIDWVDPRTKLSLKLLRDIKEDRTVFLVKNQKGEVVDAVGRSNKYGAKPKWKRYASSDTPLVCGPWHGIGVLVEDAFSAAAVSATGEYTGIALLGTNIRAGAATWIKEFKGIIVALDYDASIKGVNFTNRLNWYTVATTVILKEDLKYLKTPAILQELKTAREVLEKICQN